MARTTTYSLRTWRYTSVSVVLTIPAVIRDGDTPKYFPQIFNPDGYTITRVRALSGAVPVTDWYTGGEPYELTSLTTVAEGTINLYFQIDTVEGGVFTTTSTTITVNSALNAFSGGQGEAVVVGQSAGISSAAGDTFDVGQGVIPIGGQGATISTNASTFTGGQGVVPVAGQGATITAPGATIDNSVSASPNPADHLTTVTLTCTLSSSALTPDSVKFYRDYVSTSDYGTLIGSGTMQSATVWTYASMYDIDSYVDVRSVVTYSGSDTVSFNEIDFYVLQQFGGQGVVPVVGQGATISPPLADFVVGQGTVATAGQGATISANASTFAGGQGTVTTAGQGATISPPDADEFLVGQGVVPVAGQGATISANASTFAGGQGVVPIAGQGATISTNASTFTGGQGVISTAGQGATLGAASAGTNIAITRVVLSSGTSTQDITITDFGTPQAARFVLTTATTDDTDAADANFSIGMTDGTTHSSVVGFSEDGAASAVTYTRHANDSIGKIISDASTLVDITFNSFITDGVRINKPTNDDGLYLLTVWMVNGLDDVAVVNDTLPQTAGNQNYHNVGFQPDAGFVTTGRASTWNSGFDHLDTAHGFFSYQSSVFVNACQAHFSDDADVAADLHQRVYKDRSILCLRSSGGQQWGAGFVDSRDANGIYVETANIWSGTTNVAYSIMMMKFPTGASWFLDLSNEAPTSTGNRSTSATTFEPIYAENICSVSSDGYDTGSESDTYGVAMMTATAQYANVVSEQDAAADMVCKSRSISGASSYGVSGGSAEHEAAFVAFETDGLEENFTDAAATATRWEPRIYIG